ncbi:caspase Dronc-like isoform X2 [Eriocheir sinensis]|nr:caspase Dronc-like isoform X2 [Eriocheir sinensis]
MKTDPLAPICISPLKPTTRASSQRRISITPDHSASHIFQKKNELFWAVREGELERVEHIVRHTGPGVRSGARGCTLLHVAAENNQPHVVLFLLELISPNTVNNDGHTAAHLAAMKGHTQVLRILLSDPLLDPDKLDPSGHSYTHWLATHLFEAVLKEDVRRVRSLLSVGADADQEVGCAGRGPLGRELQVTSARQLARALRHKSILRALDTEPRMAGTPKEITCSVPQSSAALEYLPMGTLDLPVDVSPTEISGKNVYKMDAAPRGYVCLLGYGSFKGRPDLNLEGSETDAHNLANIFSKMGYSGRAHFSLTAKQTRQQLADLRDNKMLEQAGCAVFVISSHGASRRHFLTSDMQTIDTQWVLDFFKDSQCPSLKNKPKIFIWNLCRGHLQEESGRGGSQGEVSSRVDEPLRDVMCLEAASGSFSWHSFSEDATPFIGALCRTLARHAATKELTQLYRDFLQEYTDVAPDAVPQLTNHGFSKRFYFNPTKTSLN